MRGDSPLWGVSMEEAPGQKQAPMFTLPFRGKSQLHLRGGGGVSWARSGDSTNRCPSGSRAVDGFGGSKHLERWREQALRVPTHSPNKQVGRVQVTNVTSLQVLISVRVSHPQPRVHPSACHCHVGGGAGSTWCPLLGLHIPVLKKKITAPLPSLFPHLRSLSHSRGCFCLYINKTIPFRLGGKNHILLEISLWVSPNNFCQAKITGVSGLRDTVLWSNFRSHTLGGLSCGWVGARRWWRRPAPPHRAGVSQAVGPVLPTPASPPPPRGPYLTPSSNKAH